MYLNEDEVVFSSVSVSINGSALNFSLLLEEQAILTINKQANSVRS